jgi:hypothetical protein
MPKLATEHAGTGEETKGAAIASQQGFSFVFVKGPSFRKLKGK